MNKEELQEKIQNVHFYTGEQYKLYLYSNGGAFMSNKKGEQNTQIFKTLDIEDVYTFCAYFYNVLVTSEWWPVFHPKDGDYEPFYNLVMELLFRSYLKSKNLPYNFNKCKNGDKLTIKEALTPYSLKYIIKDNRCLLDSVLENDECRQLKQMFFANVSKDCFLGVIENIEFEKNMEEKQDKPLFKVGDIVKVCARNHPNPTAYPFVYTNTMLRYVGQSAIIIRVGENAYKKEDYPLTGDGASYKLKFLNKEYSKDHYYNWSSPMLEAVGASYIPVTSLPLEECSTTQAITAERTDVKTTVCVDKPLIQIVKHKINFKIKNPV